MHEEVLSDKQKKLLNLITKFSDKFCLIGGTAISLQLGHRRSIDFDLFTLAQLNHDRIRRIIRADNKIEGTVVNEAEELTLIVDGVRTTFLSHPFKIEADVSFKDIIKLPNLLTLASMKAFVLGQRAKWKDYVDIYFISQKYPFLEIVKKTKDIFGDEFNEKLFREQLLYFDDIDYSEEINYMPEFEVEDSKIKKALREIGLQK